MTTEGTRGMREGLQATPEPYVPGIGSDIAAEGVEEGAYPLVPVAGLLSLLDGAEALMPRLATLRPPLLLLSSPQDHVVEPASADHLAAHAGSPVRRRAARAVVPRRDPGPRPGAARARGRRLRPGSHGHDRRPDVPPRPGPDPRPARPRRAPAGGRAPGDHTRPLRRRGLRPARGRRRPRRLARLRRAARARRAGRRRAARRPGLRRLLAGRPAGPEARADPARAPGARCS